MFWNVLSNTVNYLISNGVDANAIQLIFFIPIVATIVVFMRQVLGMNTFGMYTPIILCLTFLILGLNLSLVTIAAAFIISIVTRYALKKVHLLFMPKLAIVMIMITLVVLGILIAGVGLKLISGQFFSSAIFPMLILGSITEKFASAQSDGGFWKGLSITLQTILISMISYIAVGGKIELGIVNFSWNFLKELVINYPETIILFLIFNILLGKWTGLRLVEYIRFREVFQHNEEE